MKKTLVISLGGSLIIPKKVNTDFLESFKKIIVTYSKKYRFVIVCGGGNTARTYIAGLDSRSVKQKVYFQSLLGISSTRLNARFMTYFFGKDASRGIPHDMKSVKQLLRLHSVVFCGALRYAKEQTSDATAAKLAHFLGCDFINMTNVKGLYDKNPKRFRSAKFIPEISHKDFSQMSTKISFKPGQHFVLDQTAAKVIKKYNVSTYIMGSDMKNFVLFLEGHHFVGTVIN